VKVQLLLLRAIVPIIGVACAAWAHELIPSPRSNFIILAWFILVVPAVLIGDKMHKPRNNSSNMGAQTGFLQRLFWALAGFTGIGVSFVLFGVHFSWVVRDLFIVVGYGAFAVSLSLSAQLSVVLKQRREMR
jgi:hypothetical protein